MFCLLEFFFKLTHLLLERVDFLLLLLKMPFRRLPIGFEFIHLFLELGIDRQLRFATP